MLASPSPGGSSRATLSGVPRHSTAHLRLERELADELDRSSRALDRNLAAPQSTPSQRAARREQAVLLADALGQLPDDYREVLILHHLEGLTFPEVASRMGRTVDSVKNVLGPAPCPSCAVCLEVRFETRRRHPARAVNRAKKKLARSCRMTR